MPSLCRFLPLTRNVFGLFIALLPATRPATAQEVLVWGVFNFPPFQILEGDHQGSGSFDGELQTLIARMPEFEHKIVPMSFARRREEFIAGTNFCTPGIFLKPAMALKLAISMPALTHLDNRVIFLKSKSALFNAGKPVDLEALFRRKELVGGVIPGRSYAPNIDAVIQRFQNAPNLLFRPLETKQLFQMLLNGDVDYLLLFSHEAAFLADQFGATGQIADIPIAGTPPYIYTHVACAGNAWGHAVIDRVNAILQEERTKPEYRKFSERWYPEEDRNTVRRYYPDMLKELH